MTQPTSSVSMRTLIQRVNRVLGKESQQLRTSRSTSERSNLGEFYIVNTSTNTIEAWHANPESLGRELGALKPWEQVA